MTELGNRISWLMPIHFDAGPGLQAGVLLGRELCRASLLFNLRCVVGDNLPPEAAQDPGRCVPFGYVERHTLVSAFGFNYCLLSAIR